LEAAFTVEYIQPPFVLDAVSLDEVSLSSKAYFSSIACPLLSQRELRSPADGGSTLHVEIDIRNSSMVYHTADNLGVLPVNNKSIVEATAKALNYDLDAVFKLIPTPGNESKHKSIIPTPCTVRDLLEKYCDLTSAPRRSELKLLSQFAKDPISKNALLRMAAKEGKDEYREKILDAHVGIADIVTRLCPSIQIPLNYFIDIVPRLQPRYYTISSSSSVHPKSIHITVSVLNAPRKDGSVFKGVCSNYLSSVPDRNPVRVFVRPSSFRLPPNVSVCY
jgi:NADPH-ferrihemoprotein reductase